MNNDNFLVTFRGVRGSIPTPLSPGQVEDKLLKALELAEPKDLKDEASRKKFLDTLEPEVGGCIGGNSSCVQLQVGGQNLIFDAGTGLRSLGLEWMNEKFGTGEGQANIFLSHTHWDHINGIPFFIPFYTKGNRFTVFCPFKDIKDRLETQQSQRFFPVPLEGFSATLDFPDMSKKTQHQLGDIQVTWKEMDHPGKSYAYRVDYKGVSCVYATDAEYKNLSRADLQPTIDFFRNADLLIFDAQYTFMEGLEKRDWGHSSAFIGVDLAVDANVKCIALYHHEPTYSDFKLMDLFEQAKRYLKPIAPDSRLEMIMAREELTLDLMQK